MEYKLSFIILVIISSFFGFFIGIFNNNLITKIEENNNNGNIQKNETISEEVNTHDNTKKNELLKNSDFMKEDDDDNYQKEKINEKEKEKEKETKENDKETKEKEEQKEKENESIIKTEDEKFHTVSIGLNIDNTYIYPFFVFITSLMDNRGLYTIYDINIITDKGLKQEYLNKINSLTDKYDNKYFKLSLYNLKEDFRGAITNRYISQAAYYRISFPSLLPHIDRLIYTDLDVINFYDLTEMFNLEMGENVYLKGSLDNPGLKNELKSLGIRTDKYMNSGILLMNLKSMRKYNIERKIRDFIKTHFLDHHDQTALNGVCYNNWEIMPLKYGVFTQSSFENLVKFNEKQDKRFRYSEAELREAYYEPVLLHYVGYDKPWDSNKNKPFKEYWWYYAKKSGFYDEILSNYRFPKTKAEELIKTIPSDGGLLRRNYKNKTFL